MCGGYGKPRCENHNRDAPEFPKQGHVLCSYQALGMMVSNDHVTRAAHDELSSVALTKSESEVGAKLSIVREK